MSYNNPLRMYYHALDCKAKEAIEQAVGFAVDGEELKKALKYDRDQYEAGFRDGIAEVERDRVEIVRCKDCRHRGDSSKCPMMYPDHSPYYPDTDWTEDEGFCHRGERNDNNEPESKT